MGRYEASVEIAAPLETVWEFLNDIKRRPDWVAITDRVLSGTGESEQLGSVYRDYGGPARFAKSESEWRVTEFDSPNRKVKEGHGLGVNRIIASTLTPSGEGTRLHDVIDVIWKWYWQPISWPLELLILNRRFQRLLHQSLDDAKRLIEADETESNQREHGTRE